MRGKDHKHLHAAHMHEGKHRAKGGKVEVDKMEASEGGGDPEVEEEAEEKKRGGKVHKRKHGGHVDGKKPHHRMDRAAPGRKRGGRVGADLSPLSSANRETSHEKKPIHQEGGISK